MKTIKELREDYEAVCEDANYLQVHVDGARDILNAFVTEYCDREGPEDEPKEAAEQSCQIVANAMIWLGI